jgi:L-lactate utilization protein LutC
VNKLLKIFGLNKESEEHHKKIDDQNADLSKNTNNNNSLQEIDPRKNMELDELFAYEFTNQGGKFLLLDHSKEIQEQIPIILQENGWNSPFITEDKIKTLVNLSKTSTLAQADVFISSCDNIIANQGKLMISSHQVKQYLFSQMPKNHIIIGTTSQFVKNMNEGLSRINRIYRKALPTKITTFSTKSKTIEENQKQLDRNIYLLLLEDYS